MHPRSSNHHDIWIAIHIEGIASTLFYYSISLNHINSIREMRLTKLKIRCFQPKEMQTNTAEENTKE